MAEKKAPSDQELLAIKRELEKRRKELDELEERFGELLQQRAAVKRAPSKRLLKGLGRTTARIEDPATGKDVLARLDKHGNVRYQDPRTGKALPADPDERRRRLEAEPEKARRDAKGRFLPAEAPVEAEKPLPAKEEILDERFETRLRLDFLFIEGTKTPTKVIGFVRADGLKGIAEAILAAASAVEAAAQSGLQGNPQVRGWRGRATVHGVHGMDTAEFMRRFATSPTPAAVRRAVAQAAARLGVRIPGEFTVSWRRIIKFKNRLGRTVERMLTVPGRPQRRFVLGEDIVDTRDTDLFA